MRELSLTGAAWVAEALGQAQTAQRYWREAVNVNPWIPDYRRNLALHLLKKEAWNELRRAWSFYSDTHNDQEQATAGDRSAMSSTYLLRILEERFGPKLNGGDVTQIQARAATTPVPQPSWIASTPSGGTQYRLLPWWPVTTTPSGQENAS